MIDLLAPEGAFSEAVNRRLDITVDQYYLENYQQRIHHLLGVGLNSRITTKR